MICTKFNIWNQLTWNVLETFMYRQTARPKHRWQDNIKAYLYNLQTRVVVTCVEFNRLKILFTSRVFRTSDYTRRNVLHNNVKWLIAMYMCNELCLYSACRVTPCPVTPVILYQRKSHLSEKLTFFVHLCFM